jgi:hypothetical protein
MLRHQADPEDKGVRRDAAALHNEVAGTLPGPRTKYRQIIDGITAKLSVPGAEQWAAFVEGLMEKLEPLMSLKPKYTTIKLRGNNPAAYEWYWKHVSDDYGYFCTETFWEGAERLVREVRPSNRRVRRSPQVAARPARGKKVNARRS